MLFLVHAQNVGVRITRTLTYDPCLSRRFCLHRHHRILLKDLNETLDSVKHDYPAPILALRESRGRQRFDIELYPLVDPIKAGASGRGCSTEMVKKVNARLRELAPGPEYAKTQPRAHLLGASLSMSASASTISPPTAATTRPTGPRPTPSSPPKAPGAAASSSGRCFASRRRHVPPREVTVTAIR